MSNPALVNLRQTPEDRRAKYWLVKSVGGSCYQAKRMRDWRLSKIERLFHLTETWDAHTQSYTRELNMLHRQALAYSAEPA